MRLKQYSRSQSCYFCGAPGPSKREHVPPQMIFNNSSCDKITVPSCEKHNNDKSPNDHTIITAIIMSASQTLKELDKKSDYLTPNVINAINLQSQIFVKPKTRSIFEIFLLIHRKA